MIALVAGLLLACGDKEPECSEEIACEFGSVCQEGECVTVPCSTSAQCAMEEYCDERLCTPGCAEDSDCYPGDSCDTDANVCEPQSCRDTQRDCGFGEFCNSANGECYGAGGYYCEECTGGDDDEQCGEGNICLNFGGGYEYCGVACEADTDCPSGYGCLQVGDINGNVYGFYCATYCWLYDDYDGSWDERESDPDLVQLQDALLTCPVDEGAL